MKEWSEQEWRDFEALSASPIVEEVLEILSEEQYEFSGGDLQEVANGCAEQGTISKSRRAVPECGKREPFCRYGRFSNHYGPGGFVSFRLGDFWGEPRAIQAATAAPVAPIKATAI